MELLLKYGHYTLYPRFSIVTKYQNISTVRSHLPCCFSCRW